MSRKKPSSQKKCVAFLIENLAKLFVSCCAPMDILFGSLSIIVLALTGKTKQKTKPFFPSFLYFPYVTNNGTKKMLSGHRLFAVARQQSRKFSKDENNQRKCLIFPLFPFYTTFVTVEICPLLQE